MDITLALELVKLVVLLTIIGYLLTYLLRGAIYLPSHPAAVEQMVRALHVRPGERAVDLGSGDGRIVIALAKAGAIAVGYEVNPILVWLSRLNIRQAGVAERATIVRKSFWRASFTDIQCVTVFGMTHIMRELEAKLQRELPSGARVASNGFRFPGWKGESVAQGVHMYRKD